MNNSPQKKAGLALIAFTVLLVFTMVLHPAGGSVQYLIKITRLIVITHGIAIFSLPVGWVGFWGLTQKLGTQRFTVLLGFSMMSLGLIAAMMAGATNGIIMPIFLQDYAEATAQQLDAMKPVLRYSFAINHAFDYIYTGAFCAAVLCWSITILRTRLLPVWLGWAGITIALGAMIVFSLGMQANSLQGFRLFVTAIVIWILLVGVTLYRQKTTT